MFITRPSLARHLHLRKILRFQTLRPPVHCNMSTRKRHLPDGEAVAVADAAAVGPLSSFDLRGFRPSPNLSDDANYMDVVMIITRSQTLRQGSMGCILVKPKGEATTVNEERGTDADGFFGRIVAAATNSSLFKSDDSDVHAEINAIGQVAKRDIKDSIVSSQGTTAYITMPPCKRCFGALHASGVRRVVSRTQHSSVLLEAASKVGIEMESLTKEEMLDQKDRMDRLFANHCAEVDAEVAEGTKNAEGNMEEVKRRRKARKEEKKARKMAKIAKKGAGGDP